MKNNYLYLSLLCVGLCFPLHSCKKDKHHDPVYAFKVGLMADVAGFNDRGFNQSALEGLVQAAGTFPLYYETRTGDTPDDYAIEIQYFIDNQFDLIITAGYNTAGAILDAANANPETDFVLLDVVVDTQPANLLCVAFDVDEASFPCGFLAAYWALKQDPGNPVTSFVGGPKIPNIEQFSVSFTHGVNWFNDMYQADVQTSGAYTADFVDTLCAAHLADSLILGGADVVFAFAGKAGNGALYQTKQAGKWGIGVDVDQYLTIPEVDDILLTSCMKEMRAVVFSVLEDYYRDEFNGGGVIYGNLSNQGVQMAPYHDFDSQIPDSIKAAIETILIQIQDGTIQTGVK